MNIPSSSSSDARQNNSITTIESLFKLTAATRILMVECSQFNPPTTTSMWALSLTDAIYAFLGFGWGKNETKSGILTRLGI